jgi:hypothetical protein
MKLGERTEFRSEKVCRPFGVLMGRLVWRFDDALLHIELPEDLEPAISG